MRSFLFIILFLLFYLLLLLYSKMVLPFLICILVTCTHCYWHHQNLITYQVSKYESQNHQTQQQQLYTLHLYNMYHHKYVCCILKKKNRKRNIIWSICQSWNIINILNWKLLADQYTCTNSIHLKLVVYFLFFKK